MDELEIDFDAAGKLSGDIGNLTNQSSKIKTSFDNAKAKISEMPQDFISTTSGIESEIAGMFDKIDVAINNTVSAFDACVNNYYELEKNGISGSSSKDSYVAAIRAENNFYWAYPECSSSMHKLSGKKIGELFTSHGATVNGNAYTFEIDGKTYKYNVGSKRLTYDGKTVDVIFMGTDSTDFNDIKNTITFLGGSGESSEGCEPMIRGEGLSDNSLAIVPFNPSDDERKNMSKTPDAVIASTLAGDFLVNGNGEKPHNSVIGYSQGAQAAFAAVGRSDDLYDSIVIVNGSAYWTKDGVNLVTRYGNYDAFKDMEIIFIECQDNNNWNKSIKMTINDLLNNGVSSSNISFYTNDSELINFLNGRGMSHSDLSSSYTGHGAGWKMIKDSNILSYLSNKA